MNWPELIIQACIALTWGMIGWVSRGAFDSFKVRRKQRAWVRGRHFAPTETSKN
jgi:hypothetical protein